MHARWSGRFLLVPLAAAALAACGGSSSAGSTPGFFIPISGMAFPSATLRAPAGATVTVVNQSAMSHTVTQEAAPDLFTPGAPAGTTPFDVPSPASRTATFTLPTGLTDGTVLYYYCRTHVSLMTPPNGTITIDSSATAGPPPG